MSAAGNLMGGDALLVGNARALAEFGQRAQRLDDRAHVAVVHKDRQAIHVDEL